MAHETRALDRNSEEEGEPDVAVKVRVTKDVDSGDYVGYQKVMDYTHQPAASTLLTTVVVQIPAKYHFWRCMLHWSNNIRFPAGWKSNQLGLGLNRSPCENTKQ